MMQIRMARRSDALGIARVHEATWKEAYNGLLDSAYLESLTPGRLGARWRAYLDRRQEDLDEQIIVATSGGAVIGFAMAGASREAFAPWEGEITMVYVLKDFRGVGVGRALMKAAADHCIRRGLFSCGVWVLRDNEHGREFYEALGGEQAGRKTDSVGGRPAPLVGYCWRDTATLAQRPLPVISPGA